MKINEYGFQVLVSYQKANFTGLASNRKWSSSTVARDILFKSVKKFRKFLKKQDLANMISLQIEMAYHGHGCNVIKVENVFLTQFLNEVKTPKSEVYNLQNVIAYINECIVNSIKSAESFRYYDPSKYINFKNSMRGATQYFNQYFNYSTVYSWNHSLRYHAIPASIKHDGPRFQKSGPKPNAQELYHKRYQKWG